MVGYQGHWKKIDGFPKLKTFLADRICSTFQHLSRFNRSNYFLHISKKCTATKKWRLSWNTGSWFSEGSSNNTMGSPTVEEYKLERWIQVVWYCISLLESQCENRIKGNIKKITFSLWLYLQENTYYISNFRSLPEHCKIILSKNILQA